MTGHPNNKGRQFWKIAKDLLSDFPGGSVALEIFDDDELAKIFDQVQAKVADPEVQESGVLGLPRTAENQMRAYAETGAKTLYPCISRPSLGVPDNTLSILLAALPEHITVAHHG